MIYLNKIKIIFISGILVNLIFFLIRFFIANIGWTNIGIFNIDMFRDYEIYEQWVNNTIDINCPYPVFIWLLRIFKPFCFIPIFSSNMLIGYFIYRISEYYQLDSIKIVFIYYFNPFTIFYFSMMLLNSCVYVLFIVIAFYYLINEKYGLSLLIGIIGCLFKFNAIIFLVFWCYRKYGILTFWIIGVIFALFLVFILNYIDFNFDITLIDYIKHRMLNYDSYSITFLPKSIFSVFIYLVGMLYCFLKIISKNESLLIQFLQFCLIFDFFFPMGLIKYYLYLSVIFYIIVNEKHNIIVIWILFLIPRGFIHSILILIYFLSNQNKI